MKIRRVPGWNLWLGILAGLFFSSCVYVRVRGDGEWLDEVMSDVHSDHDRYRHGDIEIALGGVLWDYSGSVAVDFDCEPGELERYSQSVRAQVQQRINRRGGVVTTITQTAPQAWTYAFERDGDPGEVDIEIVEQADDPDYRYQLKVSWGD